MLRASGKFDIITLDTKKLTKTLREQVEIQSRQAARAWLRAVLALVPVYTGTARGTLKPLGRVLRVAVPPVENTTGKKTFVYKGRRYPLGFEQGANYAKYEFIFTESNDSLSVVFKYDMYLPYVLWNDIYPAPAWLNLPSNPPWHALDAGSAAFSNYIREEVPKRQRITNLSEHIKVISIRSTDA